MRRSLLAHALCVLTLLLATAAHADIEYWVAVGSFKDLVLAENAQRLASAQLPEVFSITQAETPSGSFYRVLTGPYLTREVADHMQSEALRSGFKGAWILATDAGSLSMPLLSIDPYATSEPFYSDDLEFEMPDYDVPISEPTDIPGFNTPAETERSTEPFRVDEAPADYQLNKLERDQAAIDGLDPLLLV